MQIIKPIIAIMITLLALDFLWLGFISRNFFKTQIGGIMKTSPTLIPAAFVYILLTVGIFIFVLNNPFSNDPKSVFLIGSLFGLVVYGTYELTNFSMLNNWPIKVVAVDILWGAFLGGITSLIGSKFL